MRINKFIALATGISRRTADSILQEGRVLVNGLTAPLGADITPSDIVTLDNQRITTDVKIQTIMLNKPAGYVCSRDGQGSKTVYHLLPEELHHLKPVGRLDKESSGLLLMTNDGQLAHQLTHPSQQKEKVYHVSLNKPLTPEDAHTIKKGVVLDDGPSKLHITPDGASARNWVVKLSEGRNRQIRRTFGELHYSVLRLHRTSFGPYTLEDTENGHFSSIN